MGSFKGKKVFITGATGFIGSNLVHRCLQREAEVYINLRNSSDTWRINTVIDNIFTIPVDITDYEGLKDSFNKIHPDIIFHTAVFGGSSRQNDVEKIFQTNIIGTEKLVRSCKDIDYELFVNTGSSSEYGLNPDPMDETDLLKPITQYGVSKAASTLFCQTTAITENKPIVTLRLFSPFGKFEQKERLIPSLILAAINKRNPKIASPTFVRDFIFIDDVLDAYEAVFHSIDKSAGKIFNIGSGLQTSVGKVAEMVIDYLGNDVSLETGLPQAWKTEPSRWSANIERAKHELKWKPGYSLEKGLSRTIDWFKANKKLYE